MAAAHPTVELDSSRRRRTGDRMPVREFARRFVKEFREDDILGIAAEVAYHLTFAIPPILTLVVMVAAALNRFSSIPVAETLREFVVERAPASIQDVLLIAIDNAVDQVGGGTVSIGLITTAVIAIWAGSNGVGALMKAFNRAYDIAEGRPIVRKKIVAIGLTLLMAALANIAIALLIFGPQIGRWLADWIGLGSLFQTIWGIARLPVAILLMMIVLGALYTLAPNLKQPFLWISPGAVVATIIWIITLNAFRYYLMFASPGGAYGAFSSIVVLLLFLYLTSIALLVGAEVNAILQTHLDEHVIQYRAEHADELTSEEARREAQEIAGQRTASETATQPTEPAEPEIQPGGRRVSIRAALSATTVLLASALGWWAIRRRT